MKVFENQNAVITIDEELKCLVQHWRGYASSKNFREVIEKSQDLFKEKKLDKILCNTRDFGVIKKDDTDWVNSHAMPVLIERGLRYMAFVVPSNVFSRMSIENFRKESDSAVEIRYFEEVDKAEEWMADL